MARTPRTITIRVTAEEHVELIRLRAMERYVGQIMDEWVGSIADLMALYDGLAWDEVLPMAVEEITEARQRVEP